MVVVITVFPLPPTGLNSEYPGGAQERLDRAFLCQELIFWGLRGGEGARAAVRWGRS